jgi:hypothetical protein
VPWAVSDACDGAGIAAAEGVRAGFFFFLASALWAIADCAEDGLTEALIESAQFGTACADADDAQAITVTKAKAVMHIFLADKLPMSAGARTLLCS